MGNVWGTKLLSFLSLFLSSTHHDAQNLVRNPGFEENTETRKQNVSSITGGFQFISNWEVLAWQTFYCHCELPHKDNWYVSTCRSHLYAPRTGCGMVKMVYEESCDSDNITGTGERKKGCTSYLQTKLVEALGVGQVYEISFWIYFPEDAYVEDAIRDHIGFLPMLHRTSMSNNNMLDVNGFFGQRIPENEWFQIKYYIRALCPLNYLLLGAFRNKTFPLVHRHQLDHYPFFFIDDVLVQPVDESTLDSTIIPTPFCMFYEKESSRLDFALDKETTFHYPTNIFSLTADQERQLDSFISSIENRWKPVYEITGHTDSIGNENTALSKRRAEEIHAYLKDKHHIPEMRMVHFGVGSTKPAQTNESSAGRATNRRATVRVTSLTPAMGLYRYCLQLADQNDTLGLTKYLMAWIKSAPYYEVIYPLFDVRFNAMKQYRLWKRIESEIRKVYTSAYTSMDAFFLDSLRCEDQKYRTLERSILSLSGYFNLYEQFDFAHYTIPDDELAYSDKTISETLTTYLSKNHFPKISEIGRRNVEGLVHILIHDQDTNLLNQYIPIIEQHCLEGEAEWISFAMMADKLYRLRGWPQIYGTQFEKDSNGKLELATFDDILKVNARRKRIGMSQLDLTASSGY